MDEARQLGRQEVGPWTRGFLNDSDKDSVRTGLRAGWLWRARLVDLPLNSAHEIKKPRSLAALALGSPASQAGAPAFAILI